MIRQPELPLHVSDATKYHVAESKQSDNDHGSVIEFNIGNDVQNKRLNELTEVMSQPQKQTILEALTKNPDLLDDQIQSISILQNRHFQFEFIVDYLKNKYKQIECPITMEPLTAQNVLILNCGHYYDFTGLEDYMKSSNQFKSCAVCQSPITTISSNPFRPKSNMYCFESRPSERLSDNTVATISENQRNVILCCLNCITLGISSLFFPYFFPSSR